MLIHERISGPDTMLKRMRRKKDKSKTFNDCKITTCP